MEDNHEEKFSEDPMEHLKIENEIIKMKLKAQYGDAFQMFGGSESLPPDVENKFLKNMMQFEENYQNAEFITILEKLGRPIFQPSNSLTEDEMEKEIERILLLLEEQDIHMDFIYRPYNVTEVYTFLSTEFMEQEIEKEIIEGAISNFIYEEFKPNHREDLKALTHQFALAWVTKNLEPIQDHFAKELTDDKGNTYSDTIIAQKVAHFFDSFDHFKEDGFTVFDIGYQLNEDGESGFGHGEGKLRFEAILENGEEIHYEGPFKVYYTYRYGYWYIFYFVVPGFNWVN